MDRLASEDHSHIATEEIDVYRGNWWIRSNVVNFDTMPTRHQPDFKKALSTLYRLKAEDKKHCEKWSQSSSSWWQWQTNWWEPYYENFTTKMEWPLIERRNLCIRWATFHLRYESQQQLNAKFIVNISVTADSSLLSPTGGVNTIPLNTAIHEQMTTTNGYVKVCTTTSTPSTSVRPLWTIT